MKKDISFEKALEKLESIVAELEAGDLALDNSLKKYEEGVMFVRVCQEKLNEARSRVEKIMKQGDGSFKRESFEEEDE